MPIHFIDTDKQLSDICQQFSSSQFLALDTEFSRQTTYYPILALLQISDGQQIAIIDPLAIKDLQPLMALLYNEQITKVLHSARQDMEIFYHLEQRIPSPLFDTQICAAVLGYGEQISYAALVKQELGIALDKSQTRTDWLDRPLTTKQVDYAADDVRYLARLYPIMQQKLINQERIAWLQEDFQLLSSPTTYAPSPETIWKKIRGANKLKKSQLAILKTLAEFREHLAIKRDRPRRRILTDEILISLALKAPGNIAALKQQQGLSHKFIQHNGADILSAIHKGLSCQPEQQPQLPSYKKLSQDEEALASCLMAIVHLAARQNHISPNCLCTRKELEALIKGQTDIPVLSGWRKELLGKQLLKFLSGDGCLQYQAEQVQMI